MVYQDPMTSLNPLLRVRTQVVETLRGHGASDAAARKRTREVLGQVGFVDPNTSRRPSRTSSPEAWSTRDDRGGDRDLSAPVGGRQADHGARRDD